MIGCVRPGQLGKMPVAVALAIVPIQRVWKLWKIEGNVPPFICEGSNSFSDPRSQLATVASSTNKSSFLIIAELGFQSSNRGMKAFGPLVVHYHGMEMPFPVLFKERHPKVDVLPDG
jgi:hypothetical protein